MNEPHIRYTKTSDGVSIAYYAIGSGPPLVYMPPMPVTHVELEWKVDWFRAGWETFARAATFVRYDGRGFGLSDRNSTDFTVDAMVRDLEAVTDALALPALALVAPFEQSIPAIAYAARYPERVAALVLWLGVGRGLDLAEDRLTTVLNLARSDWEMCKTWFTNNLGLESTAQRQVRAIVDEMTTQEGFVAYYTAMANWDVTDLLADVKTPTLVLGRRDALYPSISVVRSLAAALPNAELVTLEGSGTGITPDAGSAMRAFLIRTFSSPVQAPSAAPPIAGLRTCSSPTSSATRR